MSWQLEVAARTLCQEARGEPIEGQQAVAYVIKNRLSDGRWGNSLASVCLWHAAFSGWWCPRGKPSYHDPNFAYACSLADNDPMLSHMCSVMQAALDSEKDPTGGATHYYAPVGTREPDWVAGDPAHGIPAAIFCGKFGHQLFYRGVK